MTYGVRFSPINAIAIWFDVKSKQFLLGDNNSVNEFVVEFS